MSTALSSTGDSASKRQFSQRAHTLHEHQDVDGVIVFAQGAGNEAVVVRVHHRGVQNPVDVPVAAAAQVLQSDSKHKRL